MYVTAYIKQVTDESAATVAFVGVLVIIGVALRVVGHGYCAAMKECADLGFVVN